MVRGLSVTEARFLSLAICPHTHSGIWLSLHTHLAPKPNLLYVSQKQGAALARDTSSSLGPGSQLVSPGDTPPGPAPQTLKGTLNGTEDAMTSFKDHIFSSVFLTFEGRG